MGGSIRKNYVGSLSVKSHIKLTFKNLTIYFFANKLSTQQTTLKDRENCNLFVNIVLLSAIQQLPLTSLFCLSS